jgi:hypothetical protein
MDLVKNYDDLSTVFNKYNLSVVDFKKKLTIVLAKFMSNVELSKQHEYVGSLRIVPYGLFNDLPMYTMILDATKLANDIITVSKNEILNSNKDFLNVWKIFVVDNLMWNLPFTLEDVIFIPVKLVKENLDLDSYYDLSRTLIHERIHVLQRANTQEWIDYVYYQDKKWILIKKDTPLFNFLDLYDINKLMNYMRVINPDTLYLDFKYGYKLDNKLYYGVLYLNPDKKIKVQWFIINEKNNTQYDKENISFYLEPIDREILPYEHPFELYAYKISEELTKVKS